MKNKDKELFLRCGCGVEILHCYKFNNEPDLWISYYEISCYNNNQWLLNLWNRIKDSIKFLFGKKVIFSTVLLNREDQKKLKNFLINLEKK